MSAWMCSQPGFSRRDTASIGPEASTRVMASPGVRWLAQCPPPLPSSSTSRTGRAARRSTRPANAASSAYSSGGEMSGHHSARSW